MIRHESLRGYFSYYLHEEMGNNSKIYLVTADLGYKMFDNIREDYTDRFINCGASEQSGMGISIGLAQEGKIPFFYSITPFLIYRPLEWIRNYVNKENCPVKLIGSGRDKDYAHDGWSHDATDIKPVLDLFPNIKQLWPKEKDEIPAIIKTMVDDPSPYFLSLKR